MKFRIEYDSLGKKKVPVNAYYGIQTQRAIDNFPISGLKYPSEFINAYTSIKKAAAVTNNHLGLLNNKFARAIIKTTDEILQGKFRNQFLVDVFQMGAGTSFNMNCNEVIANRSNEILGEKLGKYYPIHPNDHVNMSQSTNDTFPTAMRISTLHTILNLESEISNLSSSFSSKAKEFNLVVKSARTHLQDAVPITLGQEFSAYSLTINKSLQEIQHSKKSLYVLGIGGSAAGTGINTHPKYSSTIIKNLSTQLDAKFILSRDFRESMQSQQDIAHLSSTLRILSLELTRICNDLRLLSSGPRTGFSEIILPAVAPGSSIMPGKVNPSIPEMVNMVCFQVIGCDTGINFAVQAGQLELNVMMPMIAINLLFSINILTNAIRQFRLLCVDHIIANKETCRKYAENSIGLATVLNTLVGYSAASKIVQKASDSGLHILDVIKQEKILTDNEISLLFNLIDITKPGMPKLNKNKKK
ncbi:MAG: aspartate ammonia-lyase [Thaumarchaeota archaeon]|nr:aspartate ammonia-lyase [Nitrososphaerota archaeon]|tara:strand:+ start:591 stop:2006 length:1416 start_codon:yes stop_codon:yes gene_type:complete